MTEKQSVCGQPNEKAEKTPLNTKKKSKSNKKMNIQRSWRRGFAQVHSKLELQIEPNIAATHKKVKDMVPQAKGQNRPEKQKGTKRKSALEQPVETGL